MLDETLSLNILANSVHFSFNDVTTIAPNSKSFTTRN